MNIWVAEIPVTEHGEIVDEFLSRDFDPVELWDAHGFPGKYITIYDKSDHMRPVARIEERDGRPWVQPLDGDTGEPVPFRWH